MRLATITALLFAAPLFGMAVSDPPKTRQDAAENSPRGEMEINRGPGKAMLETREEQRVFPIRNGLPAVYVLADPDKPDQKEQQAAALRKEISDLKLKIAEKELQLTTLEPTKEVPFLDSVDLKRNTAGQFVQDDGQQRPSVAPLIVKQVLDKNRMLVTVGIAPRHDPNHQMQVVLIVGMPTVDIADGKIFNDGNLYFRVIGTEKIGDRTYYAVEPYTMKKK
jgi:hypothetical protein